MDLKDLLGKSGLVATLAETTVKLIADRINKDLEEKLVDACAAQFAAEDRASDLALQLAIVTGRTKDLEERVRYLSGEVR
jgi:hypothetical protein